MRHLLRSLPFLLVLILQPTAHAGAWVDGWRKTHPIWRGVHLLAEQPGTVDGLRRALPALAAAGVNVVVLEVDYHYNFAAHPELRGGQVITKESAHDLTAECHRLGIRLIPQFQCLGHQSWAGQTFPLLTVHPEFDETPGRFPGNKGIYCRSWCPRHPGVNPIVFNLIDEIAEGFDADAIHAGMDEVFLIGSEHCPRCKGRNPADLFADSVRVLRRHLHRRGLEMLIWSDRLLDGKATGLGEWEAAVNGTAPALKRIPRDVILCDWHYETLDKYSGKPSTYASPGLFVAKGYRLWPTTWKNPAAAGAFSKAAADLHDPHVLGCLVSTWGAVKPEDLPAWPALQAAFAPWAPTGP
jgi:Glycosyl hydrolase family 20, catalytic domain